MDSVNRSSNNRGQDFTGFPGPVRALQAVVPKKTLEIPSEFQKLIESQGIWRKLCCVFHNETHLEIMHSTQFATLKSHSLLVWGGGGGGGGGKLVL